MALRVLQLTTDEKSLGKIYRASLGDRVLLEASPKLQELHLQISCSDPFGEPVSLITREEDEILELLTSGPYKINFTDPFSGRILQMTVLVDPRISESLSAQPSDKSLSLDQLAVQSHLTKCCGPVSRWRALFEGTLRSGYNTVHLTPIQELGVSKSAYSLHSHLQVSSSLGIPTSTGYKEQLETLNTELRDMHNSLGLYFITDVVWNHVSICNRDILKHSNSYYNLSNTPNLIPAYLIDRTVAAFGDTLSEMSTIQHLQAMEIKLRNYLGPIGETLQRLYKIDIEELLNRKSSSQSSLPILHSGSGIQEILETVHTVDWRAREYGGKVDLQHVKSFLSKCVPDGNIEEKIREEMETFNDVRIPMMVQRTIDKVVSAIKGTVSYRFIDESGLRLAFSAHPLVDRYFHISDMSLEEELMLDVYEEAAAKQVKTCNGWTMGDSIADMSTTTAYTNREVVIWGDSVKLRYGTCRDDNPWLWDYMTRYTEDMARLFHGFRIDNCHNTPVHVGEELLRAARRVRPNLYMVAELFTGSEELDCSIINRMGINSCIRELSQATCPQHLGELTYHYGESKPCGSFPQDTSRDVTVSRDVTRLLPSRPHAMLMDQTHDNPCPFPRRPIPNMLALSGAMCAAKCSIGSNKGYDEMVPHHIHVVEEGRLYQSPEGFSALEPAKSALIDIHQLLEREGYTETFVDQTTRDIVIVTRHNPVTCSKILVVIATQFSSDKWMGDATIDLPGDEVEVLLELEMQGADKDYIYSRNDVYINGINGIDVSVRKDVRNSELVQVARKTEEDKVQLNFTLSPGCVLAVKVSASRQAQESMKFYNSVVLSSQFHQELKDACCDLDLCDMNYVLYRCNDEERVDGCGGVYNIPGYGNLAYAGIVGFLHVLEEIRMNNDTGHALCRNLVDGWWQADYTVNRLKDMQLGRYLAKVFQHLSAVPNYMRPAVFSSVLRATYAACLARIGDLVPGFNTRSSFEQNLVLASLQMIGRVGRTGVAVSSGATGRVVSMAAGLPHFSHGFMRCWGRDTFISLPGLLLTTERLKQATDMIVGFGRTVRWGLIPNLLSEGGETPRFNCRDAAWWWCRAVQLLWKRSPSILNEEVDRMFGEKCTVLDLVQEILSTHAAGIHFEEPGAGPRLDEHLKHPGFTITAGVDWETGFVRGGSPHNCGTWMDKVGSSEVAGNRGIPATPRDGAAIELVAICYQTVQWMKDLHVTGVSKYEGVQGYTCGIISYSSWESLIRQNFEQKFWYPEGAFYRDTVGGESEGDLKLRPNQAVAMVVAPELFDKDHLTATLVTMGTTLAGPVGMATLAPHDPDYRPWYNNSDQGADYSTAHGFNYHQGPEWVWCMGFYLRAKLAAERRAGVADEPEAREFYSAVLAPHRVLITRGAYRGLAELTQGGGEFCEGSCPTQAWSIACLLELMEDLRCL